MDNWHLENIENCCTAIFYAGVAVFLFYRIMVPEDPFSLQSKHFKLFKQKIWAGILILLKKQKKEISSLNRNLRIPDFMDQINSWQSELSSQLQIEKPGKVEGFLP